MSRFVPSAAGRARSADWGGPGRSLRRPGGAGGSARRRHPLSASPFPPDLLLERLSPVRLLCARRAPCAHRGRPGASAPAAGTLLSPVFRPFSEGRPSEGRPGCVTCKPCFRNRLWGASVVGNRVFPLFYPPAFGHMPPPLPPRCREPAFCLSAVRR